MDKAVIKQEEAKHFDPAIVEAYRACYDGFLPVRQRLAERADAGEVGSAS